MLRGLVGFILLLQCSFGYSQSVRINEVVSSNSVHADEDSDTPDWIELYNTTSSTIDLSGWTISDKLDNPDKWTFPAAQIGVDDYLFLWASGKDRKTLAFPHEIITENDEWKFIIPQSILSNNWNILDFDDSSWETGRSGIGYGDDDDNTVVNQGTLNVFTRKTFTVDDLEAVSELIMHIDYDDGFIAYINGTEVARSNVLTTSPNFNTTAIVDREATVYQGFPLERYSISNFQSLLNEGENVLAISVHNISNNSSDLSLIPFLSQMQTVKSNSPPVEMLGLSERLLHTNFKLSTSDDAVYLFDSSQNLIDSLVFNPLPANASRGIDASGNIAVFSATTPGAENGAGLEGVIEEEINFSVKGGPCVGCSTFPLILNGVSADSEIRFTLDNSIPTQSDALYDNPLIINETTVVRARIFKENYIPSPTQSEAYLFNADHELPVISLITDPGNFFDQDTGIYVLGETFQNNLPFFGANFWEDWERDIHFSLYEADGVNSLSLNAGTKIFGGWSRANEQKSLSIFARGRYGTSSINYPIFESRPFTEYQSLVLRNSGNDFLSSNIRDGFLTGILDFMRIETTAFKPTATYLNGEYWGMMNLREKVNEHFIASRYGVDPDALDILEHEGLAIHGTDDDFVQLRNLISSVNLANNANYNLVKEQVDIDNFILYNLFQIFVDNTDWPGNNVKYWKAHGGKWRWILFDTDFGFGRWNPNNFEFNTLEFALEPNGPNWPNPPWSTLFLRRLMVNQNFRHQFINQFADEMNSTLLPSRLSATLTQAMNHVSSEIPDHFNRWGASPFGWNNVITGMRNFAQRRPAFVKNHILSEFNLPAFHRIAIRNTQLDRGYVIINSLTIDEESNWSGDYFQSVPIRLTAIPHPGSSFSHWEGDFFSSNPEITIDMQGAMTVIPIFEADDFTGTPIVINEINYNSSEDFDTGDWIELHNNTDNLLDLSGWTIRDQNDDNAFTFPEGTFFPAKEYFIIAQDNVRFSSLLPEVDNVFYNLGFGLSASDDMVRLYDRNETLMDSVAYTDSDPWPTEPDGNGPTLELLEPSLDNSLAENWARLHDYGSPGFSNLQESSTEENIAALAITFSPNPAKNQVSISLPSDTQLEVKSINVYDVHGRLMKSVSKEALGSSKSYQLTELSDWTSGIYMVHINTDAGSVVKELVKI
jgi:hypothetical protein